MDYHRAIQTLYLELRKIDQAIATLQGLIAKDGMRAPRRRGRTSMSADERKQVSERMKQYWANRRTGGAQ